jgi:hypothetical protein
MHQSRTRSVVPAVPARTEEANKQFVKPNTKMPQGSKASYSSKQTRQAHQIEKGYEKRGTSAKTAKARAWATVNKRTGGAKGKKASS